MCEQIRMNIIIEPLYSNIIYYENIGMAFGWYSDWHYFLYDCR